MAAPKTAEFGKGNGMLLINNTLINEWGDTDPPFTMIEIDPKASLKRGRGNSKPVKTTRNNEGRRFRLCIQPNSNNSAFLSGIYSSQPDIEAQWIVKGTGEKVIVSYGVLTSIDEIGREGTDPSDDIYVLEFGVFIPVMGAA